MRISGWSSGVCASDLAGLISLQGEDVVCLLVEDLAGDRALAAHGVDGDDRPFDGQHVEQTRDRHDLVRLLRHLDLAEHQAMPRGEACTGRDPGAETMWIGAFAPVF